MRKANIRLLMLGLSYYSSFWGAQAQTATSQFDVQMTITAECQVKSAGNISFGSAGIISSNVDATSAIVVRCTNGTSYNLGLDAGTGSGATAANRLMTGPNARTISYKLYSDSARTAIWGNTAGSNAAAGTGNGTDETYSVYGRVSAQNAPAPGTYHDTITVTLTY